MHREDDEDDRGSGGTIQASFEGELLEMHERFTLELGDNLILRTILCALLLLPHGLAAHSLGLQFTLHKKGTPDGPTLLVIGGIQGDEPGGFTAASLIVTDYEITSGNVWVVPNLNFESIVRSARGVHGDMNRKFHHIHASDPEYEAVQDIKRLILDPPGGHGSQPATTAVASTVASTSTSSKTRIGGDRASSSTRNRSDRQECDGWGTWPAGSS